jgi:RNA polymerase sigma-70 factor (ECF subfamily)
MSPTDAELMQRFGGGDDEAFRLLVERHERGLLRFFFRRCFDRTLAEDCVQEVFLRLVRHRGAWRPEAKFTTYLYRIAENHWIDRYRSRQAAPDVTSLGTEVTEEGGTIEAAVDSGVRRPEEEASDRELARKIARALGQLSEEQRQVFVLAETRGLKYADIGETLGIPVGTVKSRMHAATMRLKELLESDGVAL